MGFLYVKWEKDLYIRMEIFLLFTSFYSITVTICVEIIYKYQVRGEKKISVFERWYFILGTAHVPTLHVLLVYSDLGISSS